MKKGTAIILYGDTIVEDIKAAHGTLFILCGYPYAGKSHVARELIARTGIASVSIDDIFHERGFDWDTNRLPNAQDWEGIFDTSYAKIKELLQAGKNVLYDSTNHTKASRDRLREVARSVGAASYVIYVETAVEDVWKRWEASASDKSRHTVDRNLVTTTIEAFEPPTPDENVLRVQN